MDKFQLSDDVLHDALVKYAHGQTTSQIVYAIIESEGLEDTSEVREGLRLRLRSVNPTDDKFASTKYSVLYELARASAVDVFREKSFKIFNQVFSALDGTLADLDDIEISLKNMLDTASDFDITSNSEYLNTVKTLAILPKLRIDGINAVANLVEQLSKLTPSLPSPTESDD